MPTFPHRCRLWLGSNTPTCRQAHDARCTGVETGGNALNKIRIMANTWLRFSQPTLTRQEWEQKAILSNNRVAAIEAQKKLDTLTFVAFASEEGKRLLPDYGEGMAADCAAAYGDTLAIMVSEYRNGQSSYSVEGKNRTTAKCYGVKGLTLVNGVKLDANKCVWGFCTQDGEVRYAPATDARYKYPQIYCDISKAL